MASTQEFRRRIKSVNNTKQITKAMEMIASIKMQKAVKNATTARSYIQNLWNMFEKMATLVLPKDHPLVEKRAIKNIAVILVTADRGLCGSYNTEVIKKYAHFYHNSLFLIPNSNIDVLAVGKKGAEYVRRYNKGNLIAEFPGFEDNISIENVGPIFKMAIADYLAKKYDQVSIIYTHFESSIKHTPLTRQLLPIIDEHIDKPELWAAKEENTTDFVFEPDAEAILDQILRQVLSTQIYGAILESNASKHSASMIAMKNATDNAGNLIDELKLVYNTVRQGNITREIAEISGAAEAMK